MLKKLLNCKKIILFYVFVFCVLLNIAIHIFSVTFNFSKNGLVTCINLGKKYYIDNKPVKNQWVKVNGEEMYFDKDGYQVFDKFIDGFYVGEDGYKAKSEVYLTIDGFYYFDMLGHYQKIKSPTFRDYGKTYESYNKPLLDFYDKRIEK